MNRVADLRKLRGLSLLPSRVARSNHGSSLIEFAIIAPALIALLLAIIETSLVFFAQESLETAAEAASRQLMTGQAQSANMTQAQFKTSACAALYSFMSCSNLMVDVEKASSFDSINTSQPTITFDKNGNVTNSWQYQTGGAGDIVVLRLMYIWPLPTGPLNFSLANISSSQRLLIATSVAKTEPYSG